MAPCFLPQYNFMRLNNLLKRSFAYLLLAFSFMPVCFGEVVESDSEILSKGLEKLIGQRVDVFADWSGKDEVLPSIPILLLAGHADSQGINGAGTSGEAVDLMGANPMSLSMSDELFWNLKICAEVLRIGRQMGLNITFYEPETRTIHDENDPRSNWSIGSEHARIGGYPLEIHFDAYGEVGFGSGLIPAISPSLNKLDESLALSFGRYPRLFRGGLGAPRRGIRILEVGKLEGPLEANLRSKKSREATIREISLHIISALINGLK